MSVIIVTGAGGALGSVLVRELASASNGGARAGSRPTAATSSTSSSSWAV
jgi:NAD(P)-dependent dehydrogenase (short-subunit alcohol dehydrogenase family)